MNQRIVGFDLARAYAIFGMFIVNFNFCFGSFQDKSSLGQFFTLFVGNSTAIFIILAGMGVSLMTNRHEYNEQAKLKLKSMILKRSWFLFALGLLLYDWWPGDILHFYGSYMHIAAFLLFVPKKQYLWIAFLAILIFHLLLQFIPIGTSWNFETYKYADFWTPIGFLRNTLYNGWNAIFPWLSYFMIGMFLGRLNWQAKSTKRSVFFIGLVVFLCFEGLRYLTKQNLFNEYWTNYIMSEYFPAYLPFILITAAFALIVISICMFVADMFSTSKIINALVKTGQMTLTFYVSHVTLGMLVFSKLTNQKYTGYLTQQTPIKPIFILVFVITFYIFCVIFSVYWTKKYKNGPLEIVLRKISNS
jgi:uncharacterized protein